MEGCGVIPSIPITTTITRPSLKTCPGWWMIKNRVKSPASLQRLMIIRPAIAHGRSDGFITAATESRQKECISWGFIRLKEKRKKKKQRAHAACLCNLFSLCPSTGDWAHPSHRHGMMACSCQQRAGD